MFRSACLRIRTNCDILHSEMSPQAPATPLTLRKFMIGLLFAVLMSLAPIGMVLWRWSLHWADAPDWDATGWLAATLILQGGLTYWRHYKAQLALPDWAKDAMDMANAAQPSIAGTPIVSGTSSTVPPARF